MRKLIESTHVALGGEIGSPQDWASNLIDEFHLLLTPVAAGAGQHLFEEIQGAPQLSLADVRRFASGVLVLIYTPKAQAP